MKRLIFLLFVFSLILPGCEKDDLVFTGQVTAVIRGGDIKIENGTHYRIYFMVMEASCSEVWNWAPITDGPNFIEGGRYRIRPLGEIQSCNTQATITAGEQVAIYWWKDDWEETKDLNQIRLNVK